MTGVPLVSRELQAESKRSFTYWLRVLGAGAVVVAFGLTSLNFQTTPSQLGLILFSSLNTALALAIWTVVPILTADCISREKREGTLGLLFLTPLSSRDIVLGKAVIHGLRALTILLAALPVLALPLMLGGVPWQWAVQACLTQTSALFFALAAGLIASTHQREWTSAAIMAELLSGLFALLFYGFGFLVWHWIGFRNLVGFSLIVALCRYLSKSRAARAGSRHSLVPPTLAPPGFLTGKASPSEFRWRKAGFPMLSITPANLVQVWQNYRPGWAPVAGFAFAGLAYLFFYSPLGIGPFFMATAVLTFTIISSARRLTSTWQTDIASHAQPNWVKIFSTSPFWLALFQWNKSRTLDRNPIAWLQEYSWTARLTKWGWCLVILFGEVFALVSSDIAAEQSRLNAVLILGIAFTASGSFRRERQTGALELLLVTPLQARALIWGRLWGIWGYFFPGMAVLFACWLMAPYRGNGWSWSWISAGISTFCLLPIIGLYFSLLPFHFLLAWMMTCALGLLLPWVAVVLLSQVGAPFYTGAFAFCTLQIMTALETGRRLYENLDRRTFSFHSVSG